MRLQGCLDESHAARCRAHLGQMGGSNFPSSLYILDRELLQDLEKRDQNVQCSILDL